VEDTDDKLLRNTGYCL